MLIFAQFYAGLKDTNGTLGPMRGILPCELRARLFAKKSLQRQHFLSAIKDPWCWSDWGFGTHDLPHACPFSLHSSPTKIIQPKVQWISRHIGDISVQALHFGWLDFCFYYHCALQERENFNVHFVTARVDFGIAFSIRFLSFEAFLRFHFYASSRKKSSKHAWDLIFLHINLALNVW